MNDMEEKKEVDVDQSLWVVAPAVPALPSEKENGGMSMNDDGDGVVDDNDALKVISSSPASTPTPNACSWPWTSSGRQ